MKKCKHFERQLVAYLHGELEPSDVQALEAHLEACEPCSVELAAHRETLSMLGEALEAAPAPTELRPWYKLQRFRTAPKITLGNIWFTPQFKSALAASVIAACFVFFSGLIVVFTVLPRQGYMVSFEPPDPEERPPMHLKKPKVKMRQYEPHASPRIMAKLETVRMPAVALAETSGEGDGLFGPNIPVGFNTEQYDWSPDNGFRVTLANPLSTFSIDVDRAAYANVRRFLNDNRLPPPDAVRIEEMINYFPYDYPQPSGADPFSISLEVAKCPWNEAHDLAMIGLKGVEVDTRDLPPNNLVFLLDVSGSMESPDKLPLMKAAMNMLVDQLRPEDRISIVTYAGAAGLVLEPTSDKHRISDAIHRLQPEGSTAGAAGIELAYETARKGFIEGGNNRVILATDGDFNVGASSDGELVRLIEEKRDAGVFLSVLGFGTGNLKDYKLEKLADKGNGNYAYIDDILEGRKTLVNEMGGTLLTIAKDVKIQVEFNPAQVAAYRLIGYQNRLMADEEFNDDRKDAGDLGAGHCVTALYELIPAGSGEAVPQSAELKYQKTQLVDSDDLLTVKLRYKQPDSDQSRLLVRSVSGQEAGVEHPSENFRFASEVAEFALLLRQSEHMGNASYRQVIERATAAKGQDEDGYRAEFIRLVEKARLLEEANAR